VQSCFREPERREPKQKKDYVATPNEEARGVYHYCLGEKPPTNIPDSFTSQTSDLTEQLMLKNKFDTETVRAYLKLNGNYVARPVSYNRVLLMTIV